jgi:hypothetical protein
MEAGSGSSGGGRHPPGGVLIGPAFGAGGDDEGLFDFSHGGPADNFAGVTKATVAEAAVVEFADAEAG